MEVEGGAWTAVPFGVTLAATTGSGCTVTGYQPASSTWPPALAVRVICPLPAVLVW